MGINTNLLILTPDADTDVIEKSLIDLVPRLKATKAPCFDCFEQQDKRCKVYALGIDERDIGLIGSFISTQVDHSVWILEIVDSVGLVACWQYLKGKLIEGFCDNSEIDLIQQGLPPATIHEDPIGASFANTSLSLLEYRNIDTLFEGRAREIFISPLLADWLKKHPRPRFIQIAYSDPDEASCLESQFDKIMRKAGKRWWQFWIK